MRLDLVAFGRRLFVELCRDEDDEDEVPARVGNTACDLEIVDDGEAFGFASTAKGRAWAD